ncbi:hypothetical protein ACF0H5_013524 [Mactra antiquata]
MGNIIKIIIFFVFFQDKKFFGMGQNYPSTRALTVLLFGLTNVGKSTILRRLGNIFRGMICEETNRDNEEVQFQINLIEANFDTASSLTRLRVASADAIVFIYAVDDIASFRFVRGTLEEAMKIKGPDFPCIVAANKADVEVSTVNRIIADCIISEYFKCVHIDTVANDASHYGVQEIADLLSMGLLKVAEKMLAMRTKSNHKSHTRR